MLPGMSGIELCRRLRARPDTERLPIIMLTARGEESERVRGLATGADDYIVKPFSVPELLARIRSLLRRARPERVATVLGAGDLELDREKKRVSRSGREVHLGPTEFRLLEFLMENPGRVYTREQLLDSVWGRDVYIDERTVDVHVGRLRRALNRGRAADPIRTVRGGGYSFGERSAPRPEPAAEPAAHLAPSIRRAFVLIAARRRVKIRHRHARHGLRFGRRQPLVARDAGGVGDKSLAKPAIGQEPCQQPLHICLHVSCSSGGALRPTPRGRAQDPAG